MFGDVILGGGDDNFNSRSGLVDGEIRGGEGNDIIVGTANSDGIYGGLGNDTLTGGAGEDTFVFTESTQTPSNVDLIKDFDHADDVFEPQFLNILRRIGSLLKSEFKVIAGPDSTTDVDASDRILYDKGNGDIYFDQDGSGSKYERFALAHVRPNTPIDHTDFQLAWSI